MPRDVRVCTRPDCLDPSLRGGSAGSGMRPVRGAVNRFPIQPAGVVSAFGVTDGSMYIV